MAKYSVGPLGPLKGKLGNLVASNWRDIYYLKAKPKRTEKEPTAKKKNNQQGFGFVSRWLTPLHKFLLVGFKDYHPSWDGRLSAQSYNFTHALRQNEEGFYIDYSAARFSHGELPGAKELSISLKEDRKILIRWSTEIEPLADDSDAFIYILCCPAITSLFIVGIERSRKDGEIEVQVKEAMAVGLIHVQIAFKSLKNEKTSISQYAGAIDFTPATDVVAATTEDQSPGFCRVTSLAGGLVKRYSLLMITLATLCQFWIT